MEFFVNIWFNVLHNTLFMWTIYLVSSMFFVLLATASCCGLPLCVKFTESPGNASVVCGLISIFSQMHDCIHVIVMAAKCIAVFKTIVIQPGVL